MIAPTSETHEKYGALAGRSVDDMIAGARVEVAPYKQNPMDFVLWKPSTGDQPGWDSPWGYGRPGWHIECSAMARALFGDRFDIHGGGLDLQFPHHENEIAQSCACCGDDSFANVWMHNEMLQVEGKKMSKSLGNFFSVRELLDQGYAGEVIRFVYLSTHYSKPMDWTDKKAKEAEATLRKWSELIVGVESQPRPPLKIVEALSNDLNTALASKEMHGLAKAKNWPALRASLDFLGFENLEETNLGKVIHDLVDGIEIVDSLVDKLSNARSNKDYATADKIKDALTESGVTIQITSDGIDRKISNDFDISKLEGLT